MQFGSFRSQRVMDGLSAGICIISTQMTQIKLIFAVEK